MNDTVRTVYIGYDCREDIAYRVCRYSLARRSSVALHTVMLSYAGVSYPPGGGIFDRPYRCEGTQYIDEKENRPFSTEFAFTRFLVPCLEQYMPGWALFVDSDFLFQADIEELFQLADDRYAVMVVPHNYNPPTGAKMDGVSQEPYFRKNWSSCILWNTGHPSNLELTRGLVNSTNGRYLHQFGWLRDEEIGYLPEAWNFLVGHSDVLMEPKAIHYTSGGPWMKGFEDVLHSDRWFNELAKMQGYGRDSNVE